MRYEENDYNAGRNQNKIRQRQRSYKLVEERFLDSCSGEVYHFSRRHTFDNSRNSRHYFNLLFRMARPQ